MARGRKTDPARTSRGTGHRPEVGEAIVEYLPQEISAANRRAVASSLPAGPVRESFQLIADELGDKMRDTDLQALALMVRHLGNAIAAQKHVDEHGLVIDTEWGPKPNPMIKVARDEGAAYMRIAEKYALTFESRLRAGVLQVAGQSMLKELHNDIASAIVARIVAQ